MALSANKVRYQRNLHLKRYLSATATDSMTFYEGALACWASGASTISVAADTVGLRFAGVCEEALTTGSSNTDKVKLAWGHSEWFPLTASGLAAGDEGKNAVLTDDATVTEWEDETASISIGQIEQFETLDGTAGVWVTIGQHAEGVFVQSTGAKAIIDAGDYVPTLTDTTNVAASELLDARYVRIGNTVIVYFGVTLDVTSAAATVCDISLPIASNLAAANDLVGHAVSAETVGEPCTIVGDVTLNTASMTYTAVGTGVVTWRGSFSYIVI